MIKQKRNELNYTQEEVANMLEISLRQYVRIDKEEDIPRRDILKKIIILFKLTDEEIGKYIRTILEKEKDYKNEK